MRHVISCLSLLSLTTLAVSAADDAKYTSKEGKYSVKFPAGKEVKTLTKQTGDADMRFALVEVGPDSFVVMYMDLPKTVQDDPVKTHLDRGEKGMIARSGGAKVAQSKDIEFGPKKLPGREIVCEKGGNTAKARIIIAGTRVYVLFAGGKKDFAASKEAASFLDSFEITK